MKTSISSFIALAGLALSFNAFAESVIDEVWTCKLNDGKEIEDVMKANSEWVKHMNGALDVGEIKSGTVETVVGAQDHFLFVDTYPSMAAYAAVKEYGDSEAGEAAMESISDQFEDLFECTSNQLYKYTSN